MIDASKFLIKPSGGRGASTILVHENIKAVPTSSPTLSISKYASEYQTDNFSVFFEKTGMFFDSTYCKFVLRIENSQDIICEVDGVITNAELGRVSFETPPLASGVFRYNVQMVDSSGFVRTLVSSSYIVK